jgi:hypothetical protein
VVERRAPGHVVHHHGAQRATVVGARHRSVPAPHRRTTILVEHFM